jgi:serine/threonine protein kinase
MAGGQVLFQGNSTYTQLAAIFETIDPPTDEEVAQLDSPRAVMLLQSVLPTPQRRSLSARLGSATGECVEDFLAQCLRFDPAKRATAEELLNVSAFALRSFFGGDVFIRSCLLFGLRFNAARVPGRPAAPRLRGRGRAAAATHL